MAWTQATKAIIQFAATDLSEQYFSIVKDVLYAGASPTFAGGAGAQSGVVATRAAARAAAQGCMWHFLRSVTLAVAPIAVYTAEDVYQHTAELVLPPGSIAAGSDVPFVTTSSVFDVLTHAVRVAGAVLLYVLPACLPVASCLSACLPAWPACLWVFACLCMCTHAWKVG